MIRVLIALLLPIAAAWLAIGASRLSDVVESRLVRVAIAVCVGIGASSLLAFWWAVAFGGIGPALVAVDALAWIVVAALAWWRWTPVPGARAERRRSASAGTWLVRGVFVLLAAVAVVVSATTYRAAPGGFRDATLIWNLKARFMLRGGSEWRSFVDVPWSSPSHPLLVSASVARLWAYAGEDVRAAPVMLGAVAAAALVAALVGVLGAGLPAAWLAACVMVAPWTFSGMIAAQTADLPMALYVLVTLVVLLIAWSAPRVPVLAAAGALAGFATWTKNEGLVVLFVSALVVCSLALRRRRFTPVATFVAGTLPALISLAWLKLVVAPVPPEYFGRAADGPGFLLDPARLEVVSHLAWRYWMEWGGDVGVGLLPAMTIGALIAALTPSGHVARRVLPVTAILCGAYFLVWILSPLDATWLVSTTAERLLLQVWPAIVFAALSPFSTPLRGLPAAGNLNR